MEGTTKGDIVVDQAISNFVFDLRTACRQSLFQADVDEAYGTKFQELSQKHFPEKNACWPSAEAVSSNTITKDRTPDEYFLCFYREMTIRHLFQNGKPTAQDRIDAWANYCSLFDFVIAAQDVEMLANEQWAFDIINEFIYQFQSFCQYRTDTSRRDPAEIELLKANPQAWSLGAVVAYLKQLISVSNVTTVLNELRASKTPSQRMDFTSLASPSRLHFDLGYFAIFGLSRLECLLGDYHATLKVLDPIDMHSDEELYHKVFFCYLNLFYHTGVAYLMTRRYKDATRTFSHIISHFNRLLKTGALQHVLSGDEQAAKKIVERMSILLAISMSLTPGARVDDLVLNNPKEAQRQLVERLATLDLGEYETLFEKACPKFINPAIPNYDGDSNNSHEPVRRQVSMFVKHANQQGGLGKIRSFLKLYTAIEVEKLARFYGTTPDEFRSELLAMKHLMAQRESQSGVSPIEGTVKSALDVHFYIADNMIHIDEEEKVLRHEQYFMDEIFKCSRIVTQVQDNAQKARDLAVRRAAEKARANEED